MKAVLPAAEGYYSLRTSEGVETGVVMETGHHYAMIARNDGSWRQRSEFVERRPVIDALLSHVATKERFAAARRAFIASRVNLGAL